MIAIACQKCYTIFSLAIEFFVINSPSYDFRDAPTTPGYITPWVYPFFTRCTIVPLCFLQHFFMQFPVQYPLLTFCWCLPSLPKFLQCLREILGIRRLDVQCGMLNRMLDVQLQSVQCQPRHQSLRLLRLVFAV